MNLIKSLNCLVMLVHLLPMKHTHLKVSVASVLETLTLACETVSDFRKPQDYMSDYVS